MFKAPTWEDDKNQKGIGDQIYTGAASLGMLKANIIRIGGTIIGVILLCMGIWIWTKKEKYSATIQGKVIDAQCPPVVKDQIQECLLKIEYIVNEKTYTFESKKVGYYAKDYGIEVRYDPTNPEQATLDSSYKTTGMILTGVGLFLIVAGWIYWYVVKRYKFAAAASGVSVGWNIID